MTVLDSSQGPSSKSEQHDWRHHKNKQTKPKYPKPTADATARIRQIRLGKYMYRETGLNSQQSANTDTCRVQPFAERLYFGTQLSYEDPLES